MEFLVTTSLTLFVTTLTLDAIFSGVIYLTRYSHGFLSWKGYRHSSLDRYLTYLFMSSIFLLYHVHTWCGTLSYTSYLQLGIAFPPIYNYLSPFFLPWRAKIKGTVSLLVRSILREIFAYELNLFSRGRYGFTVCTGEDIPSYKELTPFLFAFIVLWGRRFQDATLFWTLANFACRLAYLECDSLRHFMRSGFGVFQLTNEQLVVSLRDLNWKDLSHPDAIQEIGFEAYVRRRLIQMGEMWRFILERFLAVYGVIFLPYCLNWFSLIITTCRRTGDYNPVCLFIKIVCLALLIVIGHPSYLDTGLIVLAIELIELIFYPLGQHLLSLVSDRLFEIGSAVITDFYNIGMESRGFKLVAILVLIKDYHSLAIAMALSPSSGWGMMGYGYLLFFGSFSSFYLGHLIILSFFMWIVKIWHHRDRTTLIQDNYFLSAEREQVSIDDSDYELYDPE